MPRLPDLKVESSHRIYPSRPLMSANSRDILSEYSENEVRADAKYKGNFVEIKGKVDDVKKDILGKIYVTVGTGANFEIPQVQCFAKRGEEAAFAALNKGQDVIVSGRVDGLMMNVLVKDCEVNPEAKRCRSFREFMGIGSCTTDSVYIEKDSNIVASFACAPTKESLQDGIRGASDYMRSKKIVFTILQSDESLCAAMITIKKNPLSPGMEAKLQAALDKMR